MARNDISFLNGNLRNFFSSFNLSALNRFPMDINKLVEIVIGLCIKVHTKIGPGCFERVYEEIMHYELMNLGIAVDRQVLLPIRYEDLYVEDAYKLDLMIEGMLIVELKSVHPLPPVYFNQIRTHLSLAGLNMACC